MRSALAVLGVLLSAGLARGEPTVDYLYIHANEGGSSGGHAAIRFGEWTFDFQHSAEGLLQMRRQDSGRFQYVYRVLENRGMELSRVAVSADTYERLRSGFQQRFLVQERQDEIAASIAEDGRVLEALGGEPNGLVLEEAGFFFADGAAVPIAPAPRGADAGAPALRALRERIAARWGEGFLAGRREQALAALARLDTRPVDVAALAPDPQRWPLLPDTFSRRYEDATRALFALALLESPRPLRAEALARGEPGGDELALAPADVARLRAAASALSEDLVRLAASARRDWGAALLLGLARLSALEASVESGRLVLLDAYPRSAQTLPITARRRALLPELAGEARAQLAAARSRFLAGPGWDEASYRELEEAGNRFLELRAATAGTGRSGARTLRVEAGPLVPRGEVRVVGLPAPGDATPFAERLAESRAAAARYREALGRVVGYDLLRRNCVTEIFRTLEAALADPAPPEPDLEAFVREESERRLGGYVHPTASGNFIPFVSSARVRSHYAVQESSTLGGYRQQRVAEMEQREGRLRVALRESNVVTATAYRRDDQDGFFLFFTEDAGPLRPLFGALNLAAALGRSAFGVLALPFDAGRGLRAGLEGAFWSLPELAFQSVRKGTNEWVPRAERPPPG